MDMPFDFPSSLMKNLTPLKYQLNHKSELLSTSEIHSAISLFLNGESLEFIELLVEEANKRGLFEKYIGKLILKDCESLRRLYDYCLHRNNEMKQMQEITDRIIPQEKLDDYLIQLAFSSK